MDNSGGGKKLHYDESEETPFRADTYSIAGYWTRITEEEFTLVAPKPITERRWKMLLDCQDYTSASGCYYNQTAIDRDWGDHYKHPIDFIDIEIPA